jgi:hypothetical protein
MGKAMFETPDGRIKLTNEEKIAFGEYAGPVPIPSTKDEFNKILLDTASGMRARLASGEARYGDNEIRAQLIEEMVESPHAADVERRHREWIAAGCPVGEEAMRRAGLTSPALERLQRERESAVKPL